MLIRDKQFSFDSDALLAHEHGGAALDDETYSVAFRLVYRRYVYMRSLLSGHCCTQPNVDQVKSLLNNGGYARIYNAFGYTPDEVDFYVGYTDQFNRSVR